MSDNVDVKIAARFDVPQTKRRKLQRAAVQYIVVDLDEDKVFSHGPDEEEAASWI